MKPFTLIGVPIDCLGKSGLLSGTELAPGVLRSLGLAEALEMEDQGDLAVRIDDSIRDPASRIIGFESVCATTQTIRAAVRSTLRNGRRFFLVGGCCTQLIGAVNGAFDVFGPVGVANVDGHIDLYTGETSPTGEAADMPIAVLLGHGRAGLIQPPRLLLPEHLALLGFRDLEEAASRGSLLPSQLGGVAFWDANFIKGTGPDEMSAGQMAAQRLSKAPGRFILHLDFDVLDKFAATDYLMAGGLSWDQLLAYLLLPLVMSPALIGVSVACYNPELDPERECGRQIVHHLGSLFKRVAA